MKQLLEFVPLVLFFLAYKLKGIYFATGVLMAATVVQMAVIYALDRKLALMHKVTLILVLLFGAMTLVLRDERFIKWKPTVLYWTFALVLAVSALLFRKNLIRALMQEQITLPEAVWTKLNLAWVGFFTFMGIANLAVAFAFGFSTDAWVNFKLFGGIGLMLVFALLQGLMLSRYIDEEKK